MKSFCIENMFELSQDCICGKVNEKYFSISVIPCNILQKFLFYPQLSENNIQKENT